MKIDADTRNDTLCITIMEERIDAGSVVHFKDTILGYIAQHSQDRILLNLKNVQFVDSSGLGAFVSIMKSIGASKRLDLCDLTAVVQKVFNLTRMDSVFRIYASMETALQDTDAA